MTETSNVSSCRVTETGELEVTGEKDGTKTVMIIPPSKASDILLSLLKAAAHASSRPGSPYRTLVKPQAIGLERTGLAAGGWVPTLVLQLEDMAFLRIPLEPQSLPALASSLEELHRLFLTEHGPKRAH